LRGKLSQLVFKDKYINKVVSCKVVSHETDNVDEDASLIEDSTVEDCQADITGDYITGLEKENTSLKEKLKMSSLNKTQRRQ